MNKIRNNLGQFSGKEPVWKLCLSCQKRFSSFVSLEQKYCSRNCYYKYRKGIRISKETEFKKNRKNIHKGDSGWVNSGTYKRGHIGMKKESNPNWQGGVTPENAKIRNSIEFSLWRGAVFARDNWTCQKYNTKGGELIAHHIRNFAQYPELRFAIDNGITLSKKAHQEFHKRYGIKNNNEIQMKEFLVNTKN